jgi:hypothetical protein
MRRLRRGSSKTSRRLRRLGRRVKTRRGGMFKTPDITKERALINLSLEKKILMKKTWHDGASSSYFGIVGPFPVLDRDGRSIREISTRYGNVLNNVGILAHPKPSSDNSIYNTGDIRILATIINCVIVYIEEPVEKHVLKAIDKISDIVKLPPDLLARVDLGDINKDNVRIVDSNRLWYNNPDESIVHLGYDTEISGRDKDKDLFQYGFFGDKKIIKDDLLDIAKDWMQNRCLRSA